MQFKNAAIAAATAATVAALPQITPVPEGGKFGLITIRSGSPIQNAGVQAVDSNLVVGAPSQNATCDRETNFATFFIQDEELHLYSENEVLQTIFVDRSGMGMGNVGFRTGTENLGRNWETKGWALNDNQLEFKGTGFQACPGALNGGWSLWLQGHPTPGWNQNCTGVSTAAIATEDPIACTYHEYSA